MVTTYTVRRMVTETVLAPDGYIRFKDAVEKYGIPDRVLAAWVIRGKVHNVKRADHKISFVCEADVERMKEQYKPRRKNGTH